MTYPGGKSGAGVYQTIINHMPPHDIYIEPFLGAGAIINHKKPARINIGIDIDPYVKRLWKDDVIENVHDADILTHDGLKFLQTFRFKGNELVYCDPPYLQSTRSKRNLYTYEFSDEQHLELLGTIRVLPCMVMISGYYSDMYAENLSTWNHTTFEAMTRGGTKATEWLWYNFPKPDKLHDYSYVGDNYRERERINKKVKRWIKTLTKCQQKNVKQSLTPFV